MPIIVLRKCLKCPSFLKCHRPPGWSVRGRPCLLGKLRPATGRYYDLVHVPHGHIPAPRIRLWSRLPLPVKEFRSWDFFSCPECGKPSFFKLIYMCRSCEDILEYDVVRAAWVHGQARVARRARRNYFRAFLKRLEYLMLPVLVLLGKAWYVRSKRQHWSDGWRR